MISNHKLTFKPFIGIIAKPFLSWNPSILTVLSLLSCMLFFIGIVIHVYVLSIISVVGFAFDMLDGYVARTSGKTSQFGAFLDSTLDRISDFFFIASFGFGGLVNWNLVVLVLFTSFFISYIRARAEAVFPEEKHVVGIMQRTERILFLLVGFFFFLLFPTLYITHLHLLTIVFIIIVVFNCITIVQRFSSIVEKA